MKIRIPLRFSALLLCSACSLNLCIGQVTDRTNQNNQTTGQAGRLDPKTSNEVVRASQIIGQRIYSLRGLASERVDGVRDNTVTDNAVRPRETTVRDTVVRERVELENVGKVEDIVLNARTMQVQYVAVTYGGFLGFGNKLFAVPLDAIQFRTNPNDTDEVILVMDISQDRLDQSEGFDQDNWPNGADEGFQERMRHRYGVDREGSTVRTQSDPTKR